MTNSVAFNVLGSWEVRTGDQLVVIPSGQLRTLLASLLLADGEPVPVGTLTRQLWPERPPKWARATLHTYVTRLRKLLGPDLIRTTGDGYRIEVDPRSLDLYRFRDLVSRAARTDPPAAELTLLREALLLWRGTPFGDTGSSWLDHEVIPRLMEEWFAATERRIDLELVTGPPAGTVADLRKLTQRYPTRESLWARLIIALHRAGRRADALEAYQQLRETLNHELGIDPSEELNDLQRAVLRDGNALSQDTATAGGGEDRATPKRAGDNRVAATTASTAAPVPAQLPADIVDFIGRDGELAALDDFMSAGGGTKVAVLVGTAGVGKTALAVRWAHRVATEFPDGQLFVNLRGYAAEQPMRPIDALAGFIGALGVPPDRIPVDPEAAAALYRSLMAGRRRLVVLDNAADPDQVRPLLPGGAAALVLVTSRQLLTGLVVSHGARQHPVVPLPEPAAIDLVGRVLGADRVAAESAAARELVRECSCLPLALRIAAANVRADPYLDLTAYVAEQRAGSRLTPLTVEGDATASVRAALDWSYLRLPAPVQRLFRLLGVAPGADIAVEAAAALTGSDVDATSRHLRALAGGHLLERPASRRYAMHDLLRSYAADLASTTDSAADRDAATRRLLDWYLHSAVAASETLYPLLLRLPAPRPLPGVRTRTHPDHAAALAWLTTERRNITAAATFAQAYGQNRYAWLMGDALRGYFDGTGHVVDWLTVAEAAGAAAAADGSLQARASAAANLAHVHGFCGELDAAIEQATAALSASRGAGWTAGVARGLNHLGALNAAAGNPARALELFVEALALDRDIGNDAGVAARLGNIGVICGLLGKLDDALMYLHEALELHERTGHSAAWVLGNIGWVQRLTGAFDVAVDQLTRAAAAADDGDCRTQICALVELSSVHRHRRQLVDAEARAEEADAVAERIGIPDTRMISANGRALVDIQLGRYESAVRRCQQILTATGDTRFALARIRALTSLGAALRHLGDLDSAAEHADQAVKLAERSGYRIHEGEALTTLAAVAVERHRRDGETDALQQALTHARRALALQRATGHRVAEAETLMLLAVITGPAGPSSVPTRHRRAALALAAELGLPELGDLR